MARAASGCLTLMDPKEAEIEYASERCVPPHKTTNKQPGARKEKINPGQKDDLGTVVRAIRKQLFEAQRHTTKERATHQETIIRGS